MEKSFQSHYGLILSFPRFVKTPEENPAFNPTMVWFYLDYIRAKPELTKYPFNPTMVWFYLLIASTSPSISLFLSIPLWSDFIVRDVFHPKVVEKYFQSHYGLILSEAIWKEISEVKTLSIPLWSDFIKKRKARIWFDNCVFQSHYGLILSNYESRRNA